MPTDSESPTAPRPMPRRLAALGLILGLASPFAGCARDRGSITPTTTGTDFSNVPRGHMVPQPFPGSSLADNADQPPGPEAGRRISPDRPILTSGSPDAVLR